MAVHGVEEVQGGATTAAAPPRTSHPRTHLSTAQGTGTATLTHNIQYMKKLLLCIGILSFLLIFFDKPKNFIFCFYFRFQSQYYQYASYSQVILKKNVYQIHV